MLWAWGLGLGVRLEAFGSRVSAWVKSVRLGLELIEPFETLPAFKSEPRQPLMSLTLN